MAVFSGPIATAPSGDGSVVYVPLSCPPNEGKALSVRRTLKWRG